MRPSAARRGAGIAGSSDSARIGRSRRHWLPASFARLSASAWRMTGAKPRVAAAARRRRLAQRQGLGGGELAVELLDQVGDGAQAAALFAVEVGVEAVDGGLDGLEDALVAGGDGDHGLLPGGELGADGVLLDHGGDGFANGSRLADEGGDGGEPRLVAARRVQLAEGERGGGSRRSGRSACRRRARRARRARSACAGRRTRWRRRARPARWGRGRCGRGSARCRRWRRAGSGGWGRACVGSSDSGAG